MRRAVSVSLGSRRRDRATVLTLLGTPVAVAREGTDGDLAAAGELIARLDADPAVQAIGLGGIDRYLQVGGRRYAIRDAEMLAARALHTPVVDGSGLKAVWEPEVVRRLLQAGILRTGQRVLMVSAMDRFGMAAAFAELGFAVVYGDLMFAAGIDYPIRSPGELAELAAKLLPTFTARPFQELYPVGREQERPPDPRFARYFQEADVIAGDFHYIRRYLPPALPGRVVVTNTVTEADAALFAERGVAVLVTTTPVVEGRAFGTNALEAALVAVSGVTPEDPAWPEVVARAGLQCGIRRLVAPGEGQAERHE
ncbi:conserved protein of unknown function [Candidatus Hydrogenisulfobacillus filiaventi]|uniref:Quinate 5-dehydrogenase n=1 Tax=Candidatus Hydrogenisulfobacillus filiaventi TaxID=2707344 RepID=A0A6F8ZJZ4_9FIRM|nr:quinate 5-dehydrogenase [Bacillota bacterium]CAB1130003.1 conserved protein of unknown function [Candidatus Hydrogenisulfobacillus filiaventi]